jgi:hypothetical protein
MNAADEIPKRSPSLFACSLLIARLPDRTSDTRDLPPITSARSTALSWLNSIRSRKMSFGSAEGKGYALRIVERLMSIGDGKPSAEENALLSLVAALVEQFERIIGAALRCIISAASAL